MFPWNCTITFTVNLQNREFQSIFVVIAVAIATMAFFLNLIHFSVILHQRLLRNTKNIAIMSFCICGQLSSVVIAWYIYKITIANKDSEILSNYSICYFVPSGFLLVTLFTSTSLITLQVLQLHLEISCPTKAEKKCRAMTFAMVVLAWFEGIVISAIPVVGWNNWNGYCTIPHIWSQAYSMALCLLYFFHLLIIVALLLNVICTLCRKRGSVLPACNEVATVSASCDVMSLSTTPLVPSKTNKLKKVIIAFLLYVFGSMPVICYTAFVEMSEGNDPCRSIIMSANFEVGSILLVVLSAAILPLFYTFTEDDLADGMAHFIHIVCCPCNNPKTTPKIVMGQC